MTFARSATDSRSFSAARLARCSWTKSSITLSSTIAMMMTKLATSPGAAETALAASKHQHERVAKARRELQGQRALLRGLEAVGAATCQRFLGLR